MSYRKVCLLIAFSAASLGVCKHLQTRSARSANHSVCTGNLKQIGIALLNYHESYGSFPPAYITNKEGKPIHSWRILVAKILEPEKFDNYRFQESWDSPHNLKVAEQVPNYFRCPNSADEDSKGQTSYVAVVGEDTVFPFAEAVKLEDVKDDKDTTILIVEAVETGIFWTEPRDLLISEMSSQIQQDKKNGLSSNDFIGPGMVSVNGLTKRIPPSISGEQLKGMLTISGNERITWPPNEK